MMPDTLADQCNSLDDLRHEVKFCEVTQRSVRCVVPILFPATRVEANSLQMARGIGGNPDLLPCRRKHKRADAIQFAFVANGFPVCIDVAESFSGGDPQIPWRLIARVMKAREFRRFPRISGWLAQSCFSFQTPAEKQFCGQPKGGF